MTTTPTTQDRTASDRLGKLLPFLQCNTLWGDGEYYELTFIGDHGKAGRSFRGDLDAIEAQLVASGIAKQCKCGEPMNARADKCDTCLRCECCGLIEPDHAGDCVNFDVHVYRSIGR